MQELERVLFVLCTISLHRSEALIMQTPKPECRMEVDACDVLNSTMCLGTTLPYKLSSQVLANDSQNESQVMEKLGLWAGIRNVPKCWEVIQPFLCSVYMPRCYTEGNSSYIVLPGIELCEQTRRPCKVVDTYSGWPSFLQCNNTLFPSGCSQANPVTSLQFNTTSTCEKPLVKTNNRNSWYQDVEGCGIQCQNPLFTDKEHREVHIFIAVFGSLCMACTLFTVLSFIIDWKNTNRYPALILFFINACFFIGSVGWMAQFIPGARKDIVCRSDGTMRNAEPQLGAGETFSCTLVFILVYYFMIAGVTWFVILAYAWHLTFKALDYPRDAIEGKRGHFHLVAWSFPLVLTIVCLALTQIDGDSVSGICFVGYLNHTYRGFFVLLPVGLVLVIGSGFLISGLVTLIKMKMTTPGLISDKASAKIRETIIRLGIFTSFAVVFVMVTFFVHAYIFTNEPLWKKSFEEYIICEANVTVAVSSVNRRRLCTMKSRPNLVAVEVHIFAYFGAGIVMSSWVWNKATLLTWRRFLRKKFLNKDDEKANVRLHKHEIIAQAFSKRHEMNDGRISLSFYSTHDDPVGMKFDMNSISSLEMSSAWAAAIPRMIMRRGGMAMPSARRYSDSDVQSIQSTSFGVSGVIVESHSPRRNSMQSHGSHSLSHSEQDDTYRKKKKKRRHRHRGSNRIAPVNTATGATMTTDQLSIKAGSIEAGSSLVPSSQCSRCTSLVSSSLDHPPAEHIEPTDDVIRVDIHGDGIHDDGIHGDSDIDLEEGMCQGAEASVVPKPIDSDSINSEDSVFTVQQDTVDNIEEMADIPPTKDERVAENEEQNEENIPSQNSAFKKYNPPERDAPSPSRNEEYVPAAIQSHHHHTSSTYSMVTGYLPPGMMPEYAAPRPIYPHTPSGVPQQGVTPLGMPSQGMPQQSMQPQGITPQGVLPQGMTPQGMAPQGMPPQGMTPQGMQPQGMTQQGMTPQGMPPQGMSPHGMPPTGLSPHGMPLPIMPPPGMPPLGMYPEMYPGMYPGYTPPYMNNYPMTFMPHDFFMPPPPSYYPHPSMSPPYPMPPMSPPYPYPMGSPIYNPYESDAVPLPQKVEPVRYNRTRKPPTQTQQEPTEVDFPKRSKHFRENSVKRTMAYDNPAFEAPSPTVKSKAQILGALDGNHRADLKASRGSPKFSSSSTWHLDHVELESVSDLSA